MLVRHRCRLVGQKEGRRPQASDLPLHSAKCHACRTCSSGDTAAWQSYVQRRCSAQVGLPAWLLFLLRCLLCLVQVALACSTSTQNLDHLCPPTCAGHRAAAQRQDMRNHASKQRHAHLCPVLQHCWDLKTQLLPPLPSPPPLPSGAA